MSRRSRRSRSSRKRGLLAVFLRLLAGAMLAIVLGVMLGKLYYTRMIVSGPGREVVAPVEPGGQEPEREETVSGPLEAEKKGPITGPTITTRVPPLQLYRVQVGAFSQVQNARRLLAQLEELGLSGFITSKGGIHRVSLGFFTTREGAREFVEQIKLVDQEGVLIEEPLVVAETLPEIKFTHSAQDEYFQGIREVIETTTALTRETESLWLAYASGREAPAQVLAEVDRIEKEVTALSRLIGQLDPPPAAAHLQGEWQALPEDLSTALTQLRQQVEGGGKGAPFAGALARLVRLWGQL